METNFRPSGAAGQPGTSGYPQTGYQPVAGPYPSPPSSSPSSTYAPPLYPPAAPAPYGPQPPQANQANGQYGSAAYGPYSGFSMQSVPQQPMPMQGTPQGMAQGQAYQPEPEDQQPAVTEFKIGAPKPSKQQAFTGDLTDDQTITASTPLARSSQVQFGVKTGDSSLRTLLRSKIFKRAAIVLVLLGALGAGLMYTRSGERMELRSLSNGSYTYRVAFYPDAAVVKLDDGNNGLKYGDQAILSLEPSPGPEFTQCSQIGPSWKEIVRAEYNGFEVPVCSATAINYVMFVSAEGERHLVSLSYGLQRPKDIKPTLKRVFSSVRVSR